MLSQQNMGYHKKKLTSITYKPTIDQIVNAKCLLEYSKKLRRETRKSRVTLDAAERQKDRLLRNRVILLQKSYCYKHLYTTLEINKTTLIMKEISIKTIRYG